jgi:hypothetical protein
MEGPHIIFLYEKKMDRVLFSSYLFSLGLLFITNNIGTWFVVVHALKSSMEI